MNKKIDLTDREYEVITNVYGDEIPKGLRAGETEQLVKIHEQVTDAVHLSYEDDDVESLGISLPLEGKLVEVLHGRL